MPSRCQIRSSKQHETSLAVPVALPAWPVALCINPPASHTAARAGQSAQASTLTGLLQTCKTTQPTMCSIQYTLQPTPHLVYCSQCAHLCMQTTCSVEGLRVSVHGPPTPPSGVVVSPQCCKVQHTNNLHSPPITGRMSTSKNTTTG